MDREAEFVMRHVGTADRSLDVGAGIGSLEERLRRHEVIGLDRSKSVSRTARDRTAGPFLLGDATSLPVATASVDSIVFVSTLSVVSDIDAALAEATRVLTIDGTLVALLLNTRSAYVQSNLQRADSYFQRMVHRDTPAITETTPEYVDGEQENLLGVSGETVRRWYCPVEGGYLGGRRNSTGGTTISLPGFREDGSDD